jgi:tetratricopeptide (TPR) repeat protein
VFCRIAYTALNDHESAMECYRKALDLDPTNQSYQNNLEIAEQKLKEEAAKVGYCKK